MRMPQNATRKFLKLGIPRWLGMLPMGADEADWRISAWRQGSEKQGKVRDTGKATVGLLINRGARCFPEIGKAVRSLLELSHTL